MQPFIAPLSVMLLMLSVQASFVPVEDEPDHRTILKNEYVQAFRVTLAAGKSTLMHKHAHDDVAVRLSDARIAQETLGQPVSPTEHVIPGVVSARDNETRPLIHRVHNVGETVFDVIDVQILKRPAGPEAPAITAPAAENPGMRAYRYELAPGAHSTQHTHARPYLILAATDMELRMTSPEGTAMEHRLKAGDLHWVEAGVTHTLANRGAGKGVLVEIELK